jgi:nitroreductase
MTEPDAAPPFDTTVTDRLLSTTRAVRRRLDLDRPVEPAVILECLRLAVQAPTGSNSQGWRWLVVTDPAKKRALQDLYARFGRRYLSAGAAADVDAQTGRVLDSASYLVDVLDRVPVHVIPCIEGRVDGAANKVAAGFYGSIFPAVWNFMLALRSRGLGTVLTTFHLAAEEEAAALLGVPDGYSQVGLLPVAYTTGGDFRPAVRPPVEGITYWDTWGTTIVPAEPATPAEPAP